MELFGKIILKGTTQPPMDNANPSFIPVVAAAHTTAAQAGARSNPATNSFSPMPTQTVTDSNARGLTRNRYQMAASQDAGPRIN